MKFFTVIFCLLFFSSNLLSQRLGLIREDGSIDTLYRSVGAEGLTLCQGKCYQFFYIQADVEYLQHFDSVSWSFTNAVPDTTHETNPYICFPNELSWDTIAIFEWVLDTRTNKYDLKSEGIVNVFTEKCPPEPKFFSNYSTICKGNSIQFVDSTQAAPEYWEWTFEGGTPATWIGEYPPEIIYSNPGLFEVNLFVSNSSGEDSLLKTEFISVLNGPSSQNVTRQYILNFAEVINLEPCALGTEYNWSPSDGLSCADCPNPILTAIRSTDYQLIVSLDDEMCSDTCFYNLVVDPPDERIWFPSAFSPNADGINDIFKGFEHNTKLIQLKVYNRWGAEIFSSIDGSGWNGEFNGHQMEPGVFVYHAIFEKMYSGKTEWVSGEVTIIR